MLQGWCGASPTASGTSTSSECTRTDTRTDALWQAVADLGFLAVHLPEAWRRRRRHHQLTVVCEELAAAGSRSSSSSCPPRSALRGEVRHRRAVPNLAAARHRDEDGVRDHRARRGLEQPSPHHHRDATATATACAADVHLGCRRVGRDPRRRAPARTTTAIARLSLFIVDADAPGLTRTIIPVEIRAGEAVHAVLRRRAGRRRPRRTAPGVRRPQSSAS